MFRRNTRHNQKELFNSYSWMNKRTKKLLKNSWAPVFYEHVFSKIDEAPFEVLYCSDNGRPNFPVNILLSLELIKHLKGYTDEELIEQFHFNYQIMYAVGVRDLGSLPLAPRTLYEFRERLYDYTCNNPDESNILFKQFQDLSQHFCKVTNVTCDKQRMDSTHVMPNIKKAGRLSLAYDVLLNALKNLPKEILSEPLLKAMEPDFKTDLLYRSKTNEVSSRLKEILKLCAELLNILRKSPDLLESEPVSLLKRFLNEQAEFDAKSNEWTPKKNKDISPRSLQSAFDPDATFRKKGNQKHSGYVLNIAETCSEENLVQFITDYTLEPNCVSDTKMLENRLPILKETYNEFDSLYLDGGYYSSEKVKQAEELGIKLNYTDMTGTASKKLSLTEFQIDKTNGNLQVKCPANYWAYPAYIGEGDIIVAHFNLEFCKECSLKVNCPASSQKTSRVVKITPKSLIAAKIRKELANKHYRISARAAVESTNSALKRAQGAGKLRVRRINKCNNVISLKVIARNIRQFLRWAKGDFRRTNKKPKLIPDQGVSVPKLA